MTKQELINHINELLQFHGIDQGKLKYTNRSKAEFERLYEVTLDLIDVKNVHDRLAEEFTIVQIGLACLDGTTDPVMTRVLHYRKQMGAMINDLQLGA